MTSPLSAEDQRIVAHFIGDDGRLHTIPSKRSQAAGRARPHRPAVRAGADAMRRSRSTRSCGAFHPDFAALRRYLVEALFLEREDGVYWRIGGTVDV